MKNITTLLLTLVCSLSLVGQSPMASVNGSKALLTNTVHALDDAVISLEIYPNSEGWEWNGPDGYMGSGAGILLSEFSEAKQGTYVASNTANSGLSDVTFDLVYLESEFAGNDLFYESCNENIVTLNTSVEGLLYAWSTGETTSSIDVDGSTNAEYTVVVSTIFGDSDTATNTVSNIQPSINFDFVDNYPFAGGFLSLDVQGDEAAMYPITVTADDNGIEILLATLYTSTMTVITETSYYENLKLVTAQGCETFLGSFGSLSSGFGSVQMDVSYVCKNESFTLTGPVGFDSYAWSDGSFSSTYTAIMSKSEDVVLYAIDSNGIISQFTYPLELIVAPKGQFLTNDRVGIVLGSIEIMLTEYTDDMFPVYVYATETGGDEALIDVMNSESILIQLGDGEYSNLRIVSSEGCNYNLGNFSIVEGATYTDIIMPDVEVCVGNFATLTPPSDIFDGHLWNDGVTSRTRTIMVEEDMTLNVLVTDLTGNINNYIFPLISKKVTDGIFSVNNRISNVLGSIDIELLGPTQDMYPIEVYVFDSANGVEVSLGQMTTATDNFQVGDGSYFNLRIQNASGCSNVLGDFNMIYNDNRNKRITGKVWLDVASEMGVLENEESGLEGVVVRAYSTEGEVQAQAVTDAEGTYALEVASEAVFLEFDPKYNLSTTEPNMGSDDDIASDVDGSNGPGTTDMINPNETSSVNAGFVYGVLSISWNEVSVLSNDAGHEVTWNVNGDQSISHFELERSIGSINDFEMVGEVSPQENFITSNAYAYFDNNVSEVSTYYYRVKQVDVDGSFSHSKIVSINVDELFNHSSEIDVTLFPMPAATHINVSIESDKDNSQVQADIYTISGQLVLSKFFTAPSEQNGNTLINIDVSNLETNSYIINLTIGNDMITKHIVIK